LYKVQMLGPDPAAGQVTVVTFRAMHARCGPGADFGPKKNGIWSPRRALTSERTSPSTSRRVQARIRRESRLTPWSPATGRKLRSCLAPLSKITELLFDGFLACLCWSGTGGGGWWWW
jgi:hypothetical protein